VQYWQACRRRMSHGAVGGDAGLGMILVIGYAVVIGIIITVSVATVGSVLKSGNGHIQYGQAVDSAEAGVDQTLARLSKNANYATADCRTPLNPTGCMLPAQWTAGFPDRATERTWVLNAVNSAVNATPSLLQKSTQGEFVAIRPSNSQIVYSVGWEPTRANPSRMRVLRNDYLFSGYSPTNAILTKGNVAIGGSFTLASNAGTSLPPSVHSEGQISSCSSSLTKPDGTTIGGVGGGCGGTESSQTVPKIDPRGMYDQLSGTYASQWYDLCPADASVRVPSSAPCAGAIVGSSRGWSYNSGTHTWSASNPQSGIYYAYQSNIDLTAAGETFDVTLITESTNNLGCPKSFGDVHIKQTQLTPAMPFVSIFAGGSVTMDTQSAAGAINHPGLVGTQESLTMATSSAPGIWGAAVANNVCGGTNSFQGSTITFDANMTIRSADVIRSSQQTEL
jgi:hypothetical protein